MRFALLLLLAAPPALADEYFYLHRPHSGIELVCMGAGEKVCRVSRSFNLKTAASKAIPTKKAEVLLGRFSKQLKGLPRDGAPSGVVTWTISYGDFKRSAAASADQHTLFTLMSMEAELKKWLR